MDFFYSFVTKADAYADDYGYHAHFFEGGAFLYSFIVALIIAALMACIFYFGFCMSHKTIRCANLPVWLLFLFLSGGLTFIASDMVYIGSDDENAAFYDYSFYADLESYYTDKQEGAPETEKKEMNRVKNEIIENLNPGEPGEDVAFRFNISNACLSMICFYGFSLLIKGLSTNGLSIPHLFPHGRKKSSHNK